MTSGCQFTCVTFSLVAIPDEVKWPDVLGFREVGADLKFKGPIYLRDYFNTLNTFAFDKAFELLSGKAQ